MQKEINFEVTKFDQNNKLKYLITNSKSEILEEKAFDLKKRKLEAEIRMQELRAGVAPGTYSRISKKDLKKNARKGKANEDLGVHQNTEAEEREELLRGIADLKERIDNIDTIMASRKQSAEDEKDD